jgi:hypothetical protein
LFVPGICCYFFDPGPFAWRGLLPWWIPLSCFGLWMATMAKLLLEATATQQAADGREFTADPADGGSGDVRATSFLSFS